jgi:Holliday junction resolvasome RuvABC endonuclease subunit
MIVLGLDLATRAGWALYDTRQSVGAIQTGSFTCKGETYEQKARSLSLHLIGVIKRHGKPDYAAIEQPQRNVQPHQKKPSKMFPELQPEMTINAGTALLLNQLVGAAVGVLTGYGVPHETVSVATWRKGFFPAGQRGADRQDWKRMAKAQCELLRIPISNADEAEAVGVAIWAAKAGKHWELQRKEHAA